MNAQSPKVDGYVRKSKQWQQELQALRSILLDSELVEEVKWRVPCYTFAEHNVVFIGRLKECCAISFIKGVLLKDKANVLIQQTANSQSVRIIRFTSVQQIRDLEPALRDYIQQAIDVEKSGQKVKLKTVAEFDVPAEFQVRMDESSALKAAFQSLTPGRQRAYLLHFSGAKQSKTRASRVDKCLDRILSGKGIDD